MTLTEEQEVVMYEATMEPVHESFETEVFLNITETRSNLEHFEGDNAALVTPESIGPAKMLVVTAGDIVDLQVYAKLASTTSNVGAGNQATLGDALALLFGDNTAGATLYEQGVYNSLYNNRGSYLASVLDPATASGTKAYLNYVFFDKDFNLVTGKSGYLPVTATTAFELISNNGLTIEEAGYLYVYVSNEGNSSNGDNVYFDAFKVTHHKGHIVQEDHYYPFGMSINALSSSAPLSKPNKFKYSGKEEQTDFDLNWYDYGARNYDPVIGRWNQVDPMADQRNWLTTYNYVQNNPMIRIDPNGALDIYGLDKDSGDITLLEETEDETDTLVDNETGETISDNVDKGLLTNGQNIMKNGLETTNVRGGLNLVRDISMHTYDEIGGSVAKNESGDSFLQVSPYDHSKFSRNEKGEVDEIIGGFTLPGRRQKEQGFVSTDGTFRGEYDFTFHTHPGHPDAPAPSTGTAIGTAIPSQSDNQGIYYSRIKHLIYGARSASYGGRSGNTSISEFIVKGWNGKTIELDIQRITMVNAQWQKRK